MSTLKQYLSENEVYCPKCGYNLHRHEGECCPECGTQLKLSLTGPTRFSWLYLWSFGFGMFCLISCYFVVLKLISFPELFDGSFEANIQLLILALEVIGALTFIMLFIKRHALLDRRIVLWALMWIMSAPLVIGMVYYTYMLVFRS